ncbi:MAG TPA: LysM domain-containing protein [Thermoleophilaceae bacterium]|nr:LysM domain-containing protein [Thermoleophilaceae bacterium]
MRFVAPLAIVAFVIAFIIVLSSSGGGSSSSGGTSTTNRTSTSSSTTAGGKRSGSKLAHRRTYTVRAGDTLGAIAIKTGVSVTTLEDLNPGLDPQGLVAGQRLKLR